MKVKRRRKLDLANKARKKYLKGLKARTMMKRMRAAMLLAKELQVND